jgi:hypothetical protein
VLYLRQRLLSAFPRHATSGNNKFDKALLSEDNLCVRFGLFWFVWR